MKKKSKELGKARFIIDLILWIILAIAVATAYTDGRFIHKEIHIIEMCNGIPTNPQIQIPEDIKEIIEKQPEEIHWKIGGDEQK